MFTFWEKQDAIEELLAISDLFILPSETESFGLQLWEAMVRQVPVISSNTGGLPEINIYGETGFLSPVGDVDDMAANAISYPGNEETWQRLRERAFKQAQLLS